MLDDFAVLVLTPAGSGDPALAVAAQRAGHLGVLNAELPLPEGALQDGLAALAAATAAAMASPCPTRCKRQSLSGTGPRRGWAR